MIAQSAGSLPVAALVKAADESAAAVAIGDGIWMSPDISNSYLIATADGGVVINTGMLAGGPIHRARYDAIGGGPYPYVILTQSHPDHYGGLQSFSGSKVIAQRRFAEGFAYREMLKAYYGPRSGRIWNAVLGSSKPSPQPRFTVEPDILVDTRHAFSLGGRRFEIISTPGGETIDALSVWLPDDRIVFTGNLFGPAFLTMPNVNPIRCDKPRSAKEYVRSAEIILALSAKTLVTGHGEPVHGAERIATDVGRMRDAVLAIHDQTIAGMNAGKTLSELMREVALPDHLALQESYGTVPWTVRTIWEEYTGWFHQDYTTQLYDVPREAVAPEIVALAGPDRLEAAAAAHIAAGRPLECLHLVELLLTAEPRHDGGLRLKGAALAELLARAQARRNLNEIMWLRSEALAVDKARQA